MDRSRDVGSDPSPLSVAGSRVPDQAAASGRATADEEIAMGTTLNPYLSFRDDAREAMTFYADVFGGDLTVSTFGEYGDPEAPEASLVMHAQLRTDDGLVLMGADTPPGMDHTPGGALTVSLSGDEDEKLTGYWSRLSEGGQVSVPFEKQMWGDTFGMCTDRFGIPWMINLAGAGAPA